MDNREITIKKYLKNELTLDERNAFEKQMTEDPSLANEVKFERHLMYVLEKKRKEKFKEWIKNIEDGEEADVSLGISKSGCLSRFRPSYWIGGVVAVGLLILAICIGLSTPDPSEMPRAFLPYCEEAPGASQGSLESTIRKIYLRDENRKLIFSDVITQFNKQNGLLPKNATEEHIYVGHAFMNLEKLDSAIIVLNHAINYCQFQNFTPQLEDNCCVFLPYYYLGKIYERKGEKEKAISYYESVLHFKLGDTEVKKDANQRLTHLKQ